MERGIEKEKEKAKEWQSSPEEETDELMVVSGRQKEIIEKEETPKKS